jgi:hypothetical protein
MCVQISTGNICKDISDAMTGFPDISGDSGDGARFAALAGRVRLVNAGRSPSRDERPDANDR